MILLSTILVICLLVTPGQVRAEEIKAGQTERIVMLGEDEGSRKISLGWDCYAGITSPAGDTYSKIRRFRKAEAEAGIIGIIRGGEKAENLNPIERSKVESLLVVIKEAGELVKTSGKGIDEYARKYWYGRGRRHFTAAVPKGEIRTYVLSECYTEKELNTLMKVAAKAAQDLFKAAGKSKEEGS